MISMIAAVGQNRELGVGGDLVFTLPGDMKYFKQTTMGHKVVMGDVTFRSLPVRLKGREEFVASLGALDLPDGVTHVPDLFAFLEEWQDTEEEVFVIGGATIYKLALPYADKLYLTEVAASASAADVFFPEFDKKMYKKKKLGEGEDKGIPYQFTVYERK